MKSETPNTKAVVGYSTAISEVSPEVREVMRLNSLALEEMFTAKPTRQAAQEYVVTSLNPTVHTRVL